MRLRWIFFRCKSADIKKSIGAVVAVREQKSIKKKVKVFLFRYHWMGLCARRSRTHSRHLNALSQCAANISVNRLTCECVLAIVICWLLRNFNWSIISCFSKIYFCLFFAALHLNNHGLIAFSAIWRKYKQKSVLIAFINSLLIEYLLVQWLTIAVAFNRNPKQNTTGELICVFIVLDIDRQFDNQKSARIRAANAIEELKISIVCEFRFGFVVAIFVCVFVCVTKSTDAAEQTRKS